jgi:hypothetical protein
LLSNDTYAIPGLPLRDGATIKDSNQQPSTVKDIVGISLPPKDVADFLLDTYQKSVHWFMTVFHEPSFRVDYERIMKNQEMLQCDLKFVTLLMMVLAMGCESLLEYTILSY